MKTLSLLMAFGLISGLAACGSPTDDLRDNDIRRQQDSPLTDTLTRDSATWGDTTRVTDSLASPSFP